MKKILKIIVLTLIILINVQSNKAAEDTAESNPAIILAGTFIKVNNPADFSSLISDIEDELLFINLNDMYIYETNVIPKNTKVYGEVEDILEPIEGRDGAIKIKIYKLETPDKKIYNVKGHIYSENDNYIGGKETQAVYYRKVPFYNHRIKPILKVVPLNVLEMGKHTVVKAGEELFVIIEEDIKAK